MSKPKFKVGDKLRINAELCKVHGFDYPSKGYIIVTEVVKEQWRHNTTCTYEYHYNGYGKCLPDDVLEYDFKYKLSLELKKLYGKS